MKRSTIGFAVFAAILVAGCGGGSKPPVAPRPGVVGSTFKVTVFRPTGGTVRSADAFIDCGTSTAACAHDYAWTDTVKLTAVADPGFTLETWAGDCSSDAACVLDTSRSGADKYVVVSFTNGVAGHGNWTDPVLHGAQYASFLAWKESGLPTPPSGTRDCTNGGCHRPSYEGGGLAPSCNQCHVASGGAPAWASASATGLVPLGSVCSDCHGAMGMEGDGVYRHAMTTALVAGYPGPDDALACQSCHVKHEQWSPTTKASNLRDAVVAGVVPSPGGSDAAVCTSCHAVARTKTGPGPDDGTVATPPIDAALYATSAHGYAVGGSFTPDGSDFSVSCAKCHSSAGPTPLQDGASGFAVHGSADRRLRAALGRAPVVDDDAEGFCFRCHSKQSDAIGGAVKSAEGKDWYGATDMLSPGATDVYTQAQKGAAAKSVAATTASSLYFKPAGEETVSAAVQGLAATADPFNLPANTVYLSNSSAAEPMDNGYELASSITLTPSVSSFYLQTTSASVPGLTVPQSGDALANTAGTLRAMGVSAGSGSFSNVNLNSTGTNRFFHVASFTSDQVAASSIPAGNWSVTAYGRKAGTGNSNSSVTAFTRAYLYVWTAGNMRTVIAGPANEASALGNSNSNRIVTFTGVPAVALGANDRIVVDLEAQVTNTVTGGNLQYQVNSGTIIGMPGPVRLVNGVTNSYNTTTFTNRVMNVAAGTGNSNTRTFTVASGNPAWDRVSQFTTAALAAPFVLKASSSLNLSLRTSQTMANTNGAASNGCYVEFAAWRWTAADAKAELLGFLANGEAGVAGVAQSLTPTATVDAPMPTTAGLQTLSLPIVSDVSFATGDKLLVEVQVFKNSNAAGTCTVAYGGSTDGSNLNVVTADGAAMQFAGALSSSTWASYSMSPGASTASDTSVGTSQTAAAGNVRQLWKRASFVSPPVLTPTTLAASPLTLNLYGSASSAAVGARARYRVFVWTAANTQGGDVVPWTTDGLLPTIAGAPAPITTPAAAPVALGAGDRVVTELEIETSGAGGASTNAFTFGRASQASVILPSPVEFTYPEVASPSWGRHDVAAYRGVHKPNPAEETPAYLGANKHVECEDCHNPHAAGKTSHTPGTNAIAAGSPVAGVPGVQPTFDGAFTAATAYTAVPAATREYQICFKCHSDANPGRGAWNPAWTDLAQEFNPANKSGHPVVAPLGSTGSGSTPLLSAQLANGWVPGQTMYCSDCHGNDDAAGAAAQGPHASAAKFMLKGPNTRWPTQADGTTRWTWSNRTTANGTADGLFCWNCHPTTSQNTAHSQSDHNSRACTLCHVLIPHGGKLARLIVTRSALTNGFSAYVDSNLTTSSSMMTAFKKGYTSPTSISGSNCGGCGEHNGLTADALTSW